uniref:Fucosyltransferase C-terminal domain-containing protein n=1 Tax=viral metagenome TaxID=1070528 RepID=A0A6C0JK15_9ZZZZ
MYKIKIFSSFCSSEICKTNFEKVFNSKACEFYGINKKVYITTDDDYTHAIILNTSMPKINPDIPKQNVIGLAFEPYEFLGITEEFIEYSKNHIGKYFIGSKHNLPDCFIEHHSFMWHNNPNKEIYLHEKKRLVSIVLSDKKLALGHKYRHLLVNEIIKQNLPIDIYGRGAKYFEKIKDKNIYNTNTKICGDFQNVEPYEKYLYSICIENYQSNDYISEKVLDPLLHNCQPIYLGAKNINNYFDGNIILLKGHLLFDIAILKTILKSPIKYYNPNTNERNSKSINFFENIDKLF